MRVLNLCDVSFLSFHRIRWLSPFRHIGDFKKAQNLKTVKAASCSLIGRQPLTPSKIRVLIVANDILTSVTYLNSHNGNSIELNQLFIANSSSRRAMPIWQEIPGTYSISDT